MKTQLSEALDKSNEPPAPEVLRPQSDNNSDNVHKSTPIANAPKVALRPRHGIYRPSHKATFIGLAVVIAILAINAGVIVFLMNTQGKSNSEVSIAGVKISPEVLDTLGVSRNTVGSTGAELVVNPNAKFSGNLTVGGSVSIAGQLKLNSKLSASEASLTKLEAGDVALNQLNVSGDAAVTNLNLRKDMAVVGSTRLQGPVSIDQLLTVNNSVNISGNLAVGGQLSIGAFQINTLTVSGHIVTRGTAPDVANGSATGSNGTVSISGNDTSGTVATNVGTGGGNGILAYVTFINQYGNIPHVVVTAIGRGAGSVYVNRSSSGFSIGVSGALSPGGYAFDYIIMQ